MNKIYLKKLRKQDASKIFEFLQDKELSKYSGPYLASKSFRSAEDYILKTHEKEKMSSWIIRGIYLNNKIVGSIGLINIRSNNSELGFWLAKDFWGKGIMAKAVKLMLKLAKRKKLKLVCAYVKKKNIAAQKTLIKSEFKLVKSAGRDFYFEIIL